jgi:hypothetical protein
MSALERRLRSLLAIAHDATAFDVRLRVGARALSDGRVRPILVLAVPGEVRSFDSVDEPLLDLVGELHRQRARCPNEGSRYVQLSFAVDEALDLIGERTDRWNIVFDPPQGVEVAALCR